MSDAFQADLDALIATDPVIAQIEARLKKRVALLAGVEALIKTTSADLGALRSKVARLHSSLLALVAKRRRLKTRGPDYQRRVARVAKLRRELARKYRAEARKPQFTPSPADEINPYPHPDENPTTQAG